MPFKGGRRYPDDPMPDAGDPAWPGSDEFNKMPTWSDDLADMDDLNVAQDHTVEQRKRAQAEQTIVPQQMLGHYDAWLGKVGKVHEAGTTALSAYRQEIFVTRASVHYQTNNEPQVYDVASVGSQIGMTGTTALPWPVRHDQDQYLIAEGDVVTVLTGRDGRNWYMVDDLPFLAQVKSDGGAATEANAGGAGLTALSVIRKALQGDPTSTVASDFTEPEDDLKDADDVDIEYADVIPIGPLNSSHGLRCGDLVWVFRRGVYMFCDKAPKTFVAGLIVGEGGDFTTNHYHFREKTPSIAYSGDTWTASWADVTLTDPTGSGGRFGRFGDALNLAEAADKHELTTGMLVIVSEVADSDSQEVCYTFSRNPSTASADIYIGTVDEDTGGGSIAPCNQITFKADSPATVSVTNPAGSAALVTIGGSNTDTKIGEVTEDSGGVSIAPCDKMTFTDGDNVTIVLAEGDDSEHVVVTINAVGAGSDIDGGVEITDVFAGGTVTINLDPPADPGGSVTTFGSNAEGTITEDTTAWTSGGATGLAVWKCMRVFYDHTVGTPILYGFARLFTYTATGRLYSVGREYIYTIDTTEPCP